MVSFPMELPQKMPNSLFSYFLDPNPLSRVSLPPGSLMGQAVADTPGHSGPISAGSIPRAREQTH